MPEKLWVMVCGGETSADTRMVAAAIRGRGLNVLCLPDVVESFSPSLETSIRDRLGIGDSGKPLSMKQAAAVMGCQEMTLVHTNLMDTFGQCAAIVFVHPGNHLSTAYAWGMSAANRELIVLTTQPDSFVYFRLADWTFYGLPPLLNYLDAKYRRLPAPAAGQLERLDDDGNTLG